MWYSSIKREKNKTKQTNKVTGGSRLKKKAAYSRRIRRNRASDFVDQYKKFVCFKEEEEEIAMSKFLEDKGGE